MKGFRNAIRKRAVFFSWLFGRGGMKRGILLPLVLLLSAAFGSAWLLHVRGSRAALGAAADRLALGAAEAIEAELRLFLSVPETAVTVVSSLLAASGSPLFPTGSVDELPRLLAGQLAAFSAIGIISVGFEDGEYAEAQRLGDGSIRFGRAGAATGGALVLYSVDADGSRRTLLSRPGYDPRARPWYREAFGREGAVWSEPYFYVSNQAPAVAAARSFGPAGGGRAAGVVSATVDLSSLSGFLASAAASSGASAVIADGGGRALAAYYARPAAVSAPPVSAPLSPAAELPAPFGELFGAAPSDRSAAAERLVSGGEAWRAARIAAARAGWLVAAALPESAVLGPLLAAERRVALIYAAAFLAAVCVAFFIAFGISGPLRVLGAAAGDFGAEIDHSRPVRADNARALGRVAARNDELGRVASSFLALRDHLGQAFDRLNRSLEEKDILLKEVHHRVKNNLQIVSSFMSLQESESDDPVFIKAMDSLQNRVRAMSVVHETLYSSGNFSAVFMDDYFSRLAESFSGYRGRDAEISFSVLPGGVALPLDQAIPCGLIAVELATNALKHAFPDRPRGAVELCLRAVEEWAVLTVSDDGVGYDPASGAGSGGGMGSLIVEALSSQLRGSFALEPTDAGTTAKVRFPLSLA